ncbi:MAG: helix-turn-helix transcriptional regulator [Lachnospiraceae bacterium]|nr:helix-turn-helix transcriptional regulator [Lachnospiraceae bacterium]
MDLIRIGKYIAEKRKNVGLTQRQLAEKLGKSDKSVSKWERGICLPEVSLFPELCELLGISLNELFAGEDIPEEQLPEKAEETLLQMSKDSRRHQRIARWVIAVLAIIAAASVVLAGYVLSSVREQDMITGFSRELGIDLSGGKVEASTEERDNGWKSDYRMLRVHFTDKTPLQEIEASDRWHRFPMSGDMQQLVRNLKSLEVRIPETENGYYFVHNRNKQANHPYGDTEVLKGDQICATIAVYRSETNTLFLYYVDVENIWKAKEVLQKDENTEGEVTMEALLRRGYRRTCIRGDDRVQQMLLENEERDSVYLLTAYLTEEEKEKLQQMNMGGVLYDNQLIYFLQTLERVELTDLSGLIPAQEELDVYVGKTVADLKKEGFSRTGRMSDEHRTIYFYSDDTLELALELEGVERLDITKEPDETLLEAAIILHVSFRGFSTGIMERAIENQ